MSHRPTYDWEQAQEYLEGFIPDEIRQLDAAGKPNADVTTQPSIGPDVAQLVAVLLLAIRPKRVLEIGTSTGYSAIAMGRSLQQTGGRLTTVEIEPRLARIAAENVAKAGLSEVVEIVVGDAKNVLNDKSGSFGLILQDGSKEDYLHMLPQLVDLLETNGTLVTDDVLFPVMELPKEARRYQYALGLYNEALQNDRRLHTVWLPIGDGVAVSVKGNS